MCKFIDIEDCGCKDVRKTVHYSMGTCFEDGDHTLCEPCECDCHIPQEEPVEPVEEPKGCKHTEILTASRNAVVSIRAGLREIGIVIMPMSSEGQEIARQENAYDALLMDIEANGCKSCEYDKADPDRDSDYLEFVAEHVEYYGVDGLMQQQRDVFL